MAVYDLERFHILLVALMLVGFGIGRLIFSRFSLSEAEHGRIRAELDTRGSYFSRPDTQDPERFY